MNGKEKNTGAPVLLVADDDEYVRVMFRRAIANAGWELRETDSSSGALEQVLADPTAFRALLLDVEMPGPPVEDVIREIREAGCNAGILIASGMAASDRKDRLEQLVDGHFLTKPFRLQDLVRELERFK